MLSNLLCLGNVRLPVLVHHGILSSCFEPLLLCECHRPFRFPRPATAPTTTSERELSLANAMGELDAGNRDGRVCEGLEARHRCTASLDRAVVLLDEVVQIPVRPYLHVAPAGVFTSQQPQRATA